MCDHCFHYFLKDFKKLKGKEQTNKDEEKLDDDEYDEVVLILCINCHGFFLLDFF